MEAFKKSVTPSEKSVTPLERSDPVPKLVDFIPRLNGALKQIFELLPSDPKNPYCIIYDDCVQWSYFLTAVDASFAPDEVRSDLIANLEFKESPRSAYSFFAFEDLKPDTVNRSNRPSIHYIMFLPSLLVPIVLPPLTLKTIPVTHESVQFTFSTVGEAAAISIHVGNETPVVLLQTTGKHGFNSIKVLMVRCYSGW